MRAVDTNVVIRYLTGDDAGQAEKSRAVIAAGEVFVSLTVLLESEWVLRNLYGFRGQVLCAALRGFVGLPGVAVESPLVAERALDWMEVGMDFADALHLASAAGCEEFVTFDRALAKQGETLSGTRVRLL